MASTLTSTEVPEGETEDQRQLDPAILYRPGVFDAYAVLAVWYVRRLFIPMLWIGMIIAIAAGPDHIAKVTLETPEDTWNALLSPLAGVVIAIALRIGATFAALLLAIPASTAFGDRHQQRTSLGRRFGAISDRWNMASAFRSLRWTNDARAYAAARLGKGRRVALLDRIYLVANITLPIAAIVVSVIVSG